jgi:hypothetical protein
MDRGEMPERILDCKPDGRRAVGQPKLWWMDSVVEDLRKLGVKSWWTFVTDRKCRKKVYRKLRPTAGCRADDDDDDSH